MLPSHPRSSETHTTQHHRCSWPDNDCAPSGWTCRSSTAISPKRSTIWRECWCAKSSLLHAVRSYTRATTLRLLSRAGVPFSCLLRARWARAIAFCSVRKKRGLEMLSPRRKDCERVQTNVNAHLLLRRGQGSRLPFTRYGDVPLARTTPAYAHRLRGTLKGTVKYHRYRPYLGQVQGACGACGACPRCRCCGGVAREMDTIAVLGVAERVVPTRTLGSGGSLELHQPCSCGRTP